jgi:hypothetical protein
MLYENKKIYPFKDRILIYHDTMPALLHWGLDGDQLNFLNNEIDFNYPTYTFQFEHSRLPEFVQVGTAAS